MADRDETEMDETEATGQLALEELDRQLSELRSEIDRVYVAPKKAVNGDG